MYCQPRDIGDPAAGRTAILISHRFSTVRRADRIIVLADGRLLEGSHADLVAAKGRYADLFELQAAGYRSSLTEKMGHDRTLRRRQRECTFAGSH